MESAARSTGLEQLNVSVIDTQDWRAEGKRAALRQRGWTAVEDRLELEIHLPGATTDPSRSGPDHPEGTVTEIDPSGLEVLRVVAAAMADSLDGYDRNQVAALGPQAAAAAAGMPLVTAGVAETNTLIRRTLEGAGFRVASVRTDFARPLQAD